MPDADVPDLIGALAERFTENEISTREAVAIAVCMLQEAMDAPDTYADFIEFHRATIH